MTGTPYSDELALPDQQAMNQTQTDPFAQAAALLNAHAPEGERLAFVNPKEEQMLKAAGGLGVPAAGGVPSYKGDVAAPPPRDYYAETRDTLQAQVDLAPALARSEAMYRPVYTALDLADLNYMLRGSAAIPQGAFDGPLKTTTTTSDGSPQTLAEAGREAGLGDDKNGKSPSPSGGSTETSPSGGSTPTTTTNASIPNYMGNQKGLLALYEEDINPTLSRIEAKDRQDRIAGEMEAISRYAKPVSDTLREATGNAALLDELNQQALSELQSGAALDPSLRREIQQGVRAGQAARGMGYGTRDLADEATVTALQAEQLRRNRQAFAQSMVGINQATGGDPFLAILGRPSQAFQASQGIGGQAYGMSQGIGNKIFNPESQYAADVYNTNYQGQLAANTATAANKTAITGAVIGAAGSILGGAAQGGGGLGGIFSKCWVAREVYGNDNPQWLLFRAWLTEDAPRWFHDIYVRFGERFALWISDKPKLKSVIKRLMDKAINRKFN